MSPLTSQLKDTSSPVRRFLDRNFPNTKGILAGYRLCAGPLLVAGTGANPGTVGSATDWLFRFLVCPNPDVDLAMAGARQLGVKAMASLMELADRLGAVVTPDGFGPDVATPPQDRELEMAVLSRISLNLDSPLPVPSFAGPAAGSDVEGDLLARGCWALALLTELGRQGPAGFTHGPLSSFTPVTDGCNVRYLTDINAETLLSLAPEPGLGELRSLRSVLESQLIPMYMSRVGTWYLGPTFAGSGSVGGADADLIAAGLLVELKTTMGKVRAAGRTCTLEKTDMYQLLGYALLDFDDRYGLDEVSICNARYGYAAFWPLGSLIDELSGGNLDLATARREFHAVLGPIARTVW